MTTRDQTIERSALRVLARQAIGLTGADIERVVREARQKARRERRSLCFADLQAGLVGTKPGWPDTIRRRMAVHEAGHAVAHLIFGTTRIGSATIDGPTGGYIEGQADAIGAQTEEGMNSVLVTKLAGRAAEEELLGAISAGAGGSPRSDLAQATELALAMETTLGFSKETPLLYRPTEEKFAQLAYRPDLAECVNDRLEDAYARACKLIRRNRAGVEAIADALVKQGTLDGGELQLLLSDNGCNGNTEP